MRPGRKGQVTSCVSGARPTGCSETEAPPPRRGRAGFRKQEPLAPAVRSLPVPSCTGHLVLGCGQQPAYQQEEGMVSPSGSFGTTRAQGVPMFTVPWKPSSLQNAAGDRSRPGLLGGDPFPCLFSPTLCPSSRSSAWPYQGPGFRAERGTLPTWPLTTSSTLWNQLASGARPEASQCCPDRAPHPAPSLALRAGRPHVLPEAS